MFTHASFRSSQSAAEQAVMGGLRFDARKNGIGTSAKQGFSHLPNSPESGSEAER
jgi:hypothetical protein